MFLQQFEDRNPPMLHDLVIRRDGDIHQRVRRGLALIKQNRHHQRQLIVVSLQMSVHGGNRVAHHAKGHFFVRLALMFNHDIQIAGITQHLHRIEHVGAVPFQAFFDETPRLQMQRVEIADLTQFLRQVYVEEVASGIRMH